MAVKEGWRGRFFEDFSVGDVYEHPLGRTITTADNIWFTLLTQNTAPIHFDHHYASKTEFKKPLVNSCLTLSVVTGQSVTDVSERDGESCVGRGAPSQPGFRRRHRVFALRGARDPRIEIAKERRHGHGAHDRRKSRWDRGDHVQAHRDDLPARAGPDRRAIAQGLASAVDFELSEQQTAFRDLMRDFARKSIAPVAREWELAGRYPEEIVEEMKTM